jgi:hypothetical protein
MRITIRATMENADDSSAPQVVEVGETEPASLLAIRTVTFGTENKATPFPLNPFFRRPLARLQASARIWSLQAGRMSGLSRSRRLAL